MKKQSRSLFLARCGWGLFALGVLGYCAWQYFGVSGNFTITQDFSQPRNRFISLFIPQDRASDVLYNTRTGGSVQVLSEAPVYMTVQTPRAFDSVTATIHYKTAHHGPIDFGIVELLNPLAVKKQIIDFPLVQEALDAHWKSVVDEGAGQVVYSKDGLDLNAVKERIANGAVVALGDTTVPVMYREEAIGDSVTQVVPVPLRGSHEFLVYVSKGALSFSTTLVDANLSGGLDPATVLVVNEAGEEVFKQEFADDGNTTNNRVPSSEQPVSINKEGLADGVYRIVVQTSGDVLLKNIKAGSRRLVIKDHVTFAGTPRIPGSGVDKQNAVTTFTRVSGLSAVTEAAESLQTLTIQDRSIVLGSAGEKVELQDVSTDLLSSLRVPIADATVSFSGYMAFAEDAYFDPDFEMQSIRSGLQLSDVEAIVTTSSYVPSTVLYTGKEATVNLPLDHVLGNRKKLQFTLEAPDLKSEKETIEVQSIQFDFHRESLFDRLRQRFTK